VVAAGLVFFLASALQAAAAPASWSGGSDTAPLVQATFERTLHGWQGYNATLSLVRGGVAGSRAARATVAGNASDFSIVSASAVVPSTAAGDVYRAGAWVRGVPGRSLCLRVREWKGTAVAGAAQACVEAGRSWKRLPDVRYTTIGSGRLDMYVYELDARPRDAFDVDQISLAARASAPAPSPALPDPPPPANGACPPSTLDPANGASSPRPGACGPQALYSRDSPLNEQIPPNSELDPGSSAMVQELAAEARAKGWPVASNAFTNAIFFADASTPRYDVHWGDDVLTNVPIPNDVFLPGDSDGGLVVIDSSTGCEFDFARARRAPDGTWSADFVNGMPLAWSGIYPTGNSASASGFANAAGTIMASELAAGQINHALAFTMSAVKAGGAVWPATVSDGRSSAPGAIPEGARVQLDPSLDLDSLHLTPWQKTIARALQQYGMFLVDTGGAFALRVQHAGSTPLRYPWGMADYAYMPQELVPHLRVLKLPPQTVQSRYVWQSTPCTTWR